MVKYTYDAWGNHTVSGSNTTLGNLNPFRYRSYLYDTGTKLYYLKTRYYDPEVGRFLNMDGIQYANPETINGLNLYAYCRNNPVNYMDPTGHSIILALLSIVCSVVVGSVVNGLVAGANKAEGESFGAAFLGGFVNGIISGAGLAAGLAIAAVGGGIPLLIVGGAVALFSGFVGGLLGNATSQAISYGDVDWKAAAVAGGISAGTNLLLYTGLRFSGMYSSVPSFLRRYADNLIFDIIPLTMSFYLGTLPMFNPNDLRGKFD